MSWLSAPILFKTAAVLHGLSAPGHLMLGFDVVYPALNTIPAVGKNAVGRKGAQSCWNYVAVGLVAAACMNWQWARTGGPQTIEEQTAFWAMTAIHVINGYGYTQVGAYAPLGCLWLAPLLSVIAWKKS